MSDNGGDKTESGGISPAVFYGLGAFFVLNIAMLASLPPVLRGRGAPYLPTFRTHREAMFRQLQQTVGRKKEVFVDLGSGDGRVKGLFADLSIGHPPGFIGKISGRRTSAKWMLWLFTAWALS
ncbi:hypothetical protein FisN_2Lh481 [Fistulifera solaris]|uniref:Uncharacterized protein n=1 Tax=Fistulifera solaris TaxID=1519565 RepID=A0A1Z5JB12_FISSO|nr:hypothetical protein FisN_2Lh481 [Fistulifera solaris]|eukprot:GAX10951.1 hypothetical protein FisN_2Lh481 [Fistulifera solaris]